MRIKRWRIVAKFVFMLEDVPRMLCGRRMSEQDAAATNKLAMRDPICFAFKNVGAIG